MKNTVFTGILQRELDEVTADINRAEQLAHLLKQVQDTSTAAWADDADAAARLKVHMAALGDWRLIDIKSSETARELIRVLRHYAEGNLSATSPAASDARRAVHRYIAQRKSRETWLKHAMD